MHDRTAWERGEAGPQTIKGKTYKKLVKFTRRCATCGEPFAIFVTEKIAGGAADSNSFGLKNCELHRKNKAYADLGVTKEEIDELQATNEGLFETVQQLRRELANLGAEAQKGFNEAGEIIADLRKQLAQYELSAAMAAMPWQK